MLTSRVFLARLAIAAYLSIILAATNAPMHGGQIEPNLVPLVGIATGFREGVGFGIFQLIGNLVLLLPLGGLLPIAVPGLRMRHAVGAALALSLAIEVVQWRALAGRMADIDDVWLNTVGAAVGYRASGRWHR